MKKETQGWGSSMVATKYIYQRIEEILKPRSQWTNDNYSTHYQLNRLLNELSHNYFIDTNERITK